MSKNLEDALDVDTSDLAARKDFIVLKSEVGKLDIHKLVNVRISLNNLKMKVDDKDTGIENYSCISVKVKW